MCGHRWGGVHRGYQGLEGKRGVRGWGAGEGSRGTSGVRLKCLVSFYCLLGEEGRILRKRRPVFRVGRGEVLILNGSCNG